METKSFQYRDKQIQYSITGSGESVLLIHGFGEDAAVWQPQIDFLQAHCRLIVPDLPGSGHSQLIPAADIDTYAAVIKTLYDIECGTDPVIMIGHSMGGYITLSFVEEYPECVQRFGLFHSSAMADTAEKKEARRKSITFIRENGAHAFLKTSTPNLFTAAYREAHPEKVEGLITAGKQFSAAALEQYYEAMIARPDRIAVLKNFPRPVLFIIGKHDQAIPFESSMQQCHLPSISHVHILHNSAHMGMWEEENKANSILHSFITTG